jgi:hypothetical protein
MDEYPTPIAPSLCATSFMLVIPAQAGIQGLGV